MTAKPHAAVKVALACSVLLLVGVVAQAWAASMSGNAPINWTASLVYNDAQPPVPAHDGLPATPAVPATLIPAANIKGFMVYCAVVPVGAAHVAGTYDNAQRQPATARTANCPVTSEGPPVRVYAAVTQLVTLAANPADLSEYESAYSNEVTSLVTILNLSPSKAPVSVKGAVTTVCIPDPVVGGGRPVPCMVIVSP